MTISLRSLVLFRFTTPLFLEFSLGLAGVTAVRWSIWYDHWRKVLWHHAIVCIPIFIALLHYKKFDAFLGANLLVLTIFTGMVRRGILFWVKLVWQWGCQDCNSAICSFVYLVIFLDFQHVSVDGVSSGVARGLPFVTHERLNILLVCGALWISFRAINTISIFLGLRFNQQWWDFCSNRRVNDSFPKLNPQFAAHLLLLLFCKSLISYFVGRLRGQQLTIIGCSCLVLLLVHIVFMNN